MNKSNRIESCSDPDNIGNSQQQQQPIHSYTEHSHTNRTWTHTFEDAFDCVNNTIVEIL